MKANEAPEKIYIPQNSTLESGLEDFWVEHQVFDSDIEYTRTDKIKEADLEKVIEEYFKGWEVNEDLGLVKSDGWSCIVKDLYTVAKHFFELGLKAQKGE